MKKGIGYREFLACRDGIQEYLNKGYNISSIHSILFEQGKITFGRKWFYAVLTKFGMQKIKLNQLRLVGEYTVQQKSGNNDNQSIHQVQKKKTTIQDDKTSPQNKPTFEIVRLGDDAFE